MLPANLSKNTFLFLACKIAAPNGIIAKLSMRLILPLVEIHFHLSREVLMVRLGVEFEYTARITKFDFVR
jgi:hypothetical protein